jgi:hypothetical protein
MSRVASSIHPREPGSNMTSAPGMVRGCHSPSAAPVGSAKKASRPLSKTSIASIRIVAPASRAFSAVAAASVAWMYARHTGGIWPSIVVCTAAVVFPSRRNSVYVPASGGATVSASQPKRRP